MYYIIKKKYGFNLTFKSRRKYKICKNKKLLLYYTYDIYIIQLIHFLKNNNSLYFIKICNNIKEKEKKVFFFLIK
ncbi:LOW QUALITY PROTEIN: hypothetical protein PFBG_05580 [Plasmodium falciparum 7G8]|uniref:Uncharacterized protein n=2 Tax=Plasmodium falciparum TaxID=5833 RepID=A0A024X115_PLAFC|nr:LOW QUALITY PROTEIN: hypothetical protein PFMC_05591 [Plasmodium falciparum CAMP/Malaysia]EUR62367.1 LOW QUALITY PROTEIN: hypothetical protein PFBG_05580 [Plasmodium falciparum 7G8]